MLSIEVTNFSDSTAISELATLTYANLEPGFQVDGVKTVEDIRLVMSAIGSQSPPELSHLADFTRAYSQIGKIAEMYPDTIPPHTDGNGFVGLSMQLNETGDIPIMLMVKNDFKPYDSPDFDFRKNLGRHFREGRTVPGRLTIFSEGFKDTLRPTIHFFDRRDQVGPKHYTRFSQTGETHYQTEVQLNGFILRALQRIAEVA
jgi:hypothetical protein